MKTRITKKVIEATYEITLSQDELSELVRMLQYGTGAGRYRHNYTLLDELEKLLRDESSTGDRL